MSTGVDPIEFPPIRREIVTTLQVNLGYRCNQTCRHCHVNAGPNRKEIMNKTTISLIPKIIDLYDIECLDITGGAPELHPDFRNLVIEAKRYTGEVIDRCNLTIINEPGQETLAEFLADNEVTVVASLPCYESDNVDKQRGRGVFQSSIKALQKLNTLGYGVENSNLKLSLVFNPQGTTLPPSQSELETAYRKILNQKYGVTFTNLFTITNMPINRFADYLRHSGELNSYNSKLRKSYNPDNLKSVMCKSLISVDWEGNIYDCDFNQQLRSDFHGSIKNIKQLVHFKHSFRGNKINVGPHCFGCTAGNGSSCGGELQVESKD